MDIELKNLYQGPILVNSNVFDIPRRLKEIDEGYFVLFNPDNQKYEIHHSGQKDNTYCFTIPYDELDARTIDLVYKTKIENFRANLEEMKRKNEKLIMDREKSFHDKIEVTAREIHQYARRHEDNDGAIDAGAYKTKFV